MVKTLSNLKSKCRLIWNRLFLSVVLSGTALISSNVIAETTAQKWLKDTRQFKCLQNLVYHESRAEPIRGQVAVVHVVLNRVKDDRFPDTPCSVIHQKGQFSWVGKGYTVKEKDAYERSKRVVEGVLKGRYKDYSAKSIFFNSHHRSPVKGATLATRIGGHSFYAKN